MRVHTLQQAQAQYGLILDGKWTREAEWCGMLQLPDEVAERLMNSASGLPTHHIYCNRDMAPALLRAFQNVVERGLLAELESFDGCLMIRSVRGTANEPSTHCYGLAVDLNAKKNPLGGPVTFSGGFIQCFTDEGFSSGAHFHRVDGMHYSYAWE